MGAKKGRSNKLMWMYVKENIAIKILLEPCWTSSAPLRYVIFSLFFLAGEGGTAASK